MNQTTNSQNNKLMISILVFVMLLHMLWNTISAYIKGGNEAPTLLILIIAVIVLGGGAIFAAVMAYHAWKAISAQKTTVDEESSDMNIVNVNSSHI